MKASLKQIIEISSNFLKHGIGSIVFPAPQYYPKVKPQYVVDKELLDICESHYDITKSFGQNYANFLYLIAENKFKDLYTELEATDQKTKAIKEKLDAAIVEKENLESSIQNATDPVILQQYNACCSAVENLTREYDKYDHIHQTQFDAIDKKIQVDIWQLLDQAPQEILKKNDRFVEQKKHEVAPGVSLDGVTLSRIDKHNTQQNQQAEHVFYLMGNTQCRQMMYPEMVTDIKNAQTKGFDLVAHCINPRGVLKSTGEAKTAEDLIADHVTIIKNHIDKFNIPPQNITIKGHSLGAAYGAVVAARLHAQGYPVNLFHGSSFARTDVAPDILAEHATLQKIAAPVLTNSGWNIDSLTAFLSIPEANRTHIVRKGAKDEQGIINREIDGIIGYKGTLHYALKEQRKQEKAFIQSNIDAINELTAKFGESSIHAILTTPLLQTRLRHNSELAPYVDVINNNLLLLQQWYALEVGKTANFSGLKLKTLLVRLNDLYVAKFKGHQMEGANHNAALSAITSVGLKIDANDFFINSVKNRRDFFSTHPTVSIEQIKYNQKKQPLIQGLLSDNTTLLTSSITNFRHLIVNNPHIKLENEDTVRKINELVIDFSKDRISEKTFVHLFKEYTTYQAGDKELSNVLNVSASNKSFGPINVTDLTNIYSSLKETNKKILSSRYQIMAKLNIPLPFSEFDTNALQKNLDNIRKLFQAHIDKTAISSSLNRKVDGEALKFAEKHLTILRIQHSYVNRDIKLAIKRQDNTDVNALQCQLNKLEEHLTELRDTFPSYIVEKLGKKGNDINQKFTKISEMLQQSREQLQILVPPEKLEDQKEATPLSIEPTESPMDSPSPRKNRS